VRTTTAAVLPGAPTDARTDQVPLDDRQLRELDSGLGALRSVVLPETAPPLVVTTVTGATLGLVAAVTVSVSAGQPWHPPHPDYFLITFGGPAAALAVTCVTLPLIDATTRPHTVRFD
jgi:hypothetical protein